MTMDRQGPPGDFQERVVAGPPAAWTFVTWAILFGLVVMAVVIVALFR